LPLYLFILLFVSYLKNRVGCFHSVDLQAPFTIKSNITSCSACQSLCSSTSTCFYYKFPPLVSLPAYYLSRCPSGTSYVKYFSFLDKFSFVSQQSSIIVISGSPTKSPVRSPVKSPVSASNSGLSNSGAIAGIVLGACFCVLSCVGIVVFVAFYSRNRSPAPPARAVELYPSYVPAAGVSVPATAVIATGVEGESFGLKAVPEGQSSNSGPHLPSYEELVSGSQFQSVVAHQVEEYDGVPFDPSAGQINQVSITEASPVFAHVAVEAHNQPVFAHVAVEAHNQPVFAHVAVEAHNQPGFGT
jgi:hypothetical protein